VGAAFALCSATSEYLTRARDESECNSRSLAAAMYPQGAMLPLFDKFCMSVYTIADLQSVGGKLV